MKSSYALSKTAVVRVSEVRFELKLVNKSIHILNYFAMPLVMNEIA